MNSKSKLKYMTVLCAFLAMVLLPCKAYAACHNVSCGCRANGIMSCAGATCWYTDSDGCSGHSWYLYDEYGATCTSGGSVEYHCSICPGRRITSSPPLGHDWGSWYCVNSSTHKRSCRRCGWNSMKDIICQGGERMETVIIAEAVLPVDIHRRREFLSVHLLTAGQQTM